MNSSQVIVSAHNTEKTVKDHENDQYTFFVHPDANKIEIKKAFKDMWGVKVDKVQIIKTQKKFRVAGKRKPQVKRLPKKKAIIKLMKGEKFDLLKFAKPKKAKPVRYSKA